MYFSKIQIENFKSFDNLTVDLNKFNVIVGECSSGKSNFMEIFKFLKGLSENFKKTIRNFNGKYLQNNQLKEPTYIKLEITDDNFLKSSNYINGIIYYKNIEYELSFIFKNDDYEILYENVRFDFEIYENEFQYSKLLLKNTLVLKNENNEITAYFENENCDMKYFVPKSLLNIVNNNYDEYDGLVINSPLSFLPISWTKYFNKMNFYDLNPKLSKSIFAQNHSELNETGNNLSSVLEKILNDENDKKKFLLYVSNILPHITDIEIREYLNNEKVFVVYEKFDKTPILASDVSDGTVNILSLIYLLHFSNSDVLLIEESERYIHPSLLMKIICMMRQTNKQIFITTQSPEILDYSNLDNIHLMKRNLNGFSKVVHPKNSE